MVDTSPNGLTATISTAIFSVVKSSFSSGAAAAAKAEDATGNTDIAMAHNIPPSRLLIEFMPDSFHNRLINRLLEWKFVSNLLF
jgi:hypothetical protein